MADNENENETNNIVAVQPAPQGSGLMASEQSRAVAEIQGQMILARQYPRTFKTYMPRILEACQRKKLAQCAAWTFPRGNQTINGPSIRLAEVIAQAYGNLDYGVRELATGNGESLVQSFCYDLETNVRAQKTFTVKHVRWTKNGGAQRLKDPRDIYEAVANYAARRLRACILGIVPGDIVDKALAECDKTLSDQGTVPIKDKITSMISMFDKVGVSVEMIEKRLQHDIEVTDWPEIVTLSKIYTSIVDGAAKREAFFELPNGEKEADEKITDLKDGLQGPQSEITIKGNGSPETVESKPTQPSGNGSGANSELTKKPEHQTEMKLTEPVLGSGAKKPIKEPPVMQPHLSFGPSNEVEKIEVPKKETTVQRRLRVQIEKNRQAEASKN